MKITKAVITAAGRGQRTLPLQTLIDRDGTEKSVLGIIVEEILRANVEEICVVVRPGDDAPYAEVAGDHAGRLHFVDQPEPLGYGHAVYCAKDFVGADSFLHLVGDHLYVSRTDKGCAQHLVEVAGAQACAVSAVQATRENLLPYYGVVGGRRLAGESAGGARNPLELRRGRSGSVRPISACQGRGTVLGGGGAVHRSAQRR